MPFRNVWLLAPFLAACASRSPEAVPVVPPAVSVRGLDCHLHLPPAEAGAPLAAILGALDEAGLERGCVLSPGWHPAPDCADASCEGQRAYTERENDAVIALASGADGRLLPFCGIPVTATFGPGEVDRCASRGARGLKVHLVGERVLLSDPAQAETRLRFEAILERAGRGGLVTLVHLQMDDAAEVRAFFASVAKHPGATVVAAHQIAQSLALLPEAPSNLWIEVSGLTHAPAEAGQYFVPMWRAFGLQRILLGSDYPQLSPAAHVEILRQYPLTPEEREQVVVSNGERLFP
ncbi:MAG: amidohydrolase family protein [Myxococcota bacterium]